MTEPTEAQIETVLWEVLSWSRERSFAGHSKHDALNSPWLSACTLNLRLLRLVAIQAVMRFPWNLRSALGVPKRRNPKGIGLFAHACLDLAAWPEPGKGGRQAPWDPAEEARRLLTWLIDNASPWAAASAEVRTAFGLPPGPQARPATPDGASLEGLGWGYHYPWQDVGFFQPRHYPNRVVTCWIGFAFLRAYELLGHARYLLAAREIARFILRNPRTLFESREQWCLSYVPLKSIDWAVMDVSALSGAFCARLAAALPPDDETAPPLRCAARRLMAFVIDKQTAEGAWFYTWPANASHIKHDNYHSGIILDCLADWIQFGGEAAALEAYRKGLAFYRERLFLPDGAPRWTSESTFPHDIHGAAAGILCFSRASALRVAGEPMRDAEDWQHAARNSLGWTLANLYSGRGFFHYQKYRRFTKRFCLMRWCNAWMCRAIAQHLLFSPQDGA